MDKIPSGCEVYVTDLLNMTSLMEHTPTTSHRGMARPDPLIVFPALAGSATHDSLTTIRDHASGVMTRSVGLTSVPCSLGAPLRGAAGSDGGRFKHAASVPLLSSLWCRRLRVWGGVTDCEFTLTSVKENRFGAPQGATRMSTRQCTRVHGRQWTTREDPAGSTGPTAK